MRVQIQKDQAVWERCTFYVEVEDGLTGDELDEALLNAVYAYDGYGEPDHRQEILDEPVYGIDTETVAILPDGTEHHL